MNKKEALLNALPIWFCSVVFTVYYYQIFDLWSGKQVPNDEVIVHDKVVVYTEGSLEVTI